MSWAWRETLICIVWLTARLYVLLTAGDGLFAWSPVWMCVHVQVSGHVYRYCSLIAAPSVCLKALCCPASSRWRTTDCRATPRRLTRLHELWELFQIIQWTRKDELHSRFPGWGFKNGRAVACCCSSSRIKYKQYSTMIYDENKWDK